MSAKSSIGAGLQECSQTMTKQSDSLRGNAPEQKQRQGWTKELKKNYSARYERLVAIGEEWDTDSSLKKDDVLFHGPFCCLKNEVH